MPARPPHRPKRQSLRQALREQMNIFGAVILRDMRTRFFNHGLGFLIVPLFPFVHIFALLLLNNTLGSRFDYGDDLNIFLGSGLIPTLTFMYMSRMMSMSLVMNRPMLSYPIIGMLDVVFGRAVLEVMSAVWMAAAVMGVLYLLGSDVIPHDPVQAVAAFGVALLLAMGAGLVVSLIGMAADTIVTVWALFLILIYLTSGSFFVISVMPEIVIDILSWNPVLHCVEWMRSAYYPGYSDRVLDKFYVISFAVVLLCGGLLAERITRRRLLIGG